ncbi:YqcI/YcgG family protein [Neobacillus notoginsengisoli]|uniref:YqcI/YcgG family protein n=2 Tax=Neobacillus notoginsengisoli TaxID=1578198 RepID=A0A417YS98_9BACI|nr:YqcI/YcgG family protein [Neobacillus notoginsengisoli]
MTDVQHPFPCIPATLGHKLHQLRFGFLPSFKDPSSIRELAEALNEFSEIYHTTGPYASLVLFYETPADHLANVEEYEQIFWDQLGSVSQIDQRPWPSHIPNNPEDSLWEFCFHGEQYFVYCGTPAHKNRQSRYFPYLMLAITPRSVLVEFNQSKARAAKIKSQIRKRLANYDSAPAHPDLNTYGQDDNYEWKQYFLRDDDTSIWKCPFHRYVQTKNEIEE